MCAFKRDGKRDGFEALLARGSHLGFEIEVCGVEERARGLELNPACGFELRVFVVAEVGLLAGVGVLHDVPAVAGEVGAVDDERADGSLPRGLLELVGPAAVVGERLAAEELRVVRWRVADDAEDDLAFHIDARVVVPAELRRDDSVADEDDGSVDVGDLSELAVVDGVVVGVGQIVGVQHDRHAAALRLIRHEGEVRLVADSLGSDEVDLLQVGSVVARGLEAVERELRGDVLRGDLSAARAGAAAFQQIVGEKFYVRTNFFRVDGVSGGLYPGRNCLRQRGCAEREEREGNEAESFHVRAPAERDDDLRLDATRDDFFLRLGFELGKAHLAHGHDIEPLQHLAGEASERQRAQAAGANPLQVCA